MAGNVRLIDPMEVVSKLPNGTPDYEKMFIFAELTAERRGRSVLTFESSKGSVTLDKPLGDTNITMMGVDYSDKNNIKMTTKWTDNTTNSTQLLEGFGISNIKVKVTSSFVPTVVIEFVDIRGMTFYNLGSSSPYSILIDFPPPIFNLTLKGYYGRALTYQLHLVKSNTRFESSSGNFYTTVEFVARTFSPLTDVPFKYIDIFPFINVETQSDIDPKSQPDTNTKNADVNPNGFNPNASVKPRNTNELIKKLQNLYDDIADLKNTSDESKQLEESQTAKSKGVVFLNNLSAFKNEIDNKYRNNAIIAIKEKKPTDGANADSGGSMRIVTRVIEYNSVIASDKTDGMNDKTKNSKLLLLVKNRIVRKSPTNLNLSTVENNTDSLTSQMDTYRDTLLRKSNDITTVKNDEILKASKYKDYEFIDKKEESQSSEDYVEYIGIDITGMYMSLYKYVGEKDKEITDSKIQLTGLANQAAIQNLGMKPTLYNIFEILCNDIDKFYNKLRYTTIEAERHHNKYQNLIVSDSSIKDTKIGAFPLYISANTTSNVTREARSIPVTLSDNLANSGGEEFPEIRLVNDFIRVFIETQKTELIDELKTQEDAQGNNVWIPSTPVDTISINSDAESPYLNLEYQYQGVSNDELIDKVYNKIIERFYVASQYSYGNTFYDNGTDQVAQIKLLAGSEASNLATSLINANIINNLLDKTKTYKTNSGVSIFFDDMKKIYRYSNIEPTYLTVGNNFDQQQSISGGDHSDSSDDSQLGSTALIRNRSDENFIGFKIFNSTPELRVSNEGTNSSVLNPVDKYLNRDKGFFRGLLETINLADEDTIVSLTKENVTYFPDVESNDDYKSKFLKPIDFKGFSNILSIFDDVGSFITNWSYYFEDYDSDVLNFITGTTYSNDVIAFAIAANFFNTRSFFDKSKLRNELNINETFQQPSIVEIPFYSIIYMGGLVNYNTDTGTTTNSFKNQVNRLINEKFIKNDRANFFAQTKFNTDIASAQKLSLNDQGVLLGFFNKFISPTNNGDDGFLKIKTAIKSLLDNNKNSDDKQELYENLLQNDYVASITNKLNTKYAIAIYSQYTFADENNETDDYQPLSISNTNSTLLNSNTIYFAEFFNVLSQSLEKREEQINAIDSEISVSIGDNDIKSQLYYSFKSISDKWISGLGSTQKGFPLNDDANDSLISKFAFVDRAMNPIGKDCIINVESLLEASQDFDVSVFTVMAKLLSLNGFEFFPLQNFMVHTDGQWEDSFKIFETVNQTAKPAFVCMYIGGTSSTLNNPSSDYDDDGFNMQNPPKDFNAKITGTTGNFPYSQVRAFKVGYAEQNQSFFTDIKLDTIEHTETNESLSILSKIANDESKSVPVPKGQNLFNVYENRSYSTTVSMLGNMMVQPTQYFQLENIPMFSGAYVILDVEHNVTPNHMITSFHGVRVLKYPNPIVTEFATSIGIQGGSSQDLSSDIAIDTLLNDPIYEEARKNGIVSAIISGVTPTTWSSENDAKISTLHPFIRDDVANLINVLDQNGFRMTLNSAFRSYSKQASLRADYDARLRANPSNPGLPASKAGFSMHNFGLAIDMGLIDDKGNYIPSANNTFWNQIGEIAEKQGFRWGGRFANYDPVHFEMSLGYGYVAGDNGVIYNGSTVQYAQKGTLATLRSLYENNKRVGEYVYL